VGLGVAAEKFLGVQGGLSRANFQPFNGRLREGAKREAVFQIIEK
jgi:hypothetical protein